MSRFTIGILRFSKKYPLKNVARWFACLHYFLCMMWNYVGKVTIKTPGKRQHRCTQINKEYR